MILFFLRIEFSKNHFVELFKIDLGVFHRLALEMRRHQGSARLGNRATGTLEADVVNDPFIADGEVDMKIVAAKRVHAVTEMRRVFNFPEVSRLAIMIQNDLLVQLTVV